MIGLGRPFTVGGTQCHAICSELALAGVMAVALGFVLVCSVS